MPCPARERANLTERNRLVATSCRCDRQALIADVRIAALSPTGNAARKLETCFPSPEFGQMGPVNSERFPDYFDFSTSTSGGATVGSLRTNETPPAHPENHVRLKRFDVSMVLGNPETLSQPGGRGLRGVRSRRLFALPRYTSSSRNRKVPGAFLFVTPLCEGFWRFGNSAGATNFFEAKPIVAVHREGSGAAGASARRTRTERFTSRFCSSVCEPSPQ